MTKRTKEPQIVPDSEYHGVMRLIPAVARPYALLARMDRPIGTWLLYWPGAWAIALAGGLRPQWPLLLWFWLGAWAMRGAGCVYNDIVDQDIDRQVERTRLRPLASGQVSPARAWGWLVLLCMIGLLVLWQLRWEAQLVALASLALVAAYPFMKRVTGWPQLWLGLVFSWAAPTGWVAVTGGYAPALGWLYAGSILWVVGYDTIYALQDREDDALVGIGSSALSLGRYAKTGIAVMYALAMGCWAMAIWAVRPQPLALVSLIPMAAHLGAQWWRLRPDDGARALALFRSNRFAGLLMALACAAVGSAG